MSEKHELCLTCVHTRCQLGAHAYMQTVLDKGCGQYQPLEQKPSKKKPPMTNFDRITASPEALAEMLVYDKYEHWNGDYVYVGVVGEGVTEEFRTFEKAVQATLAWLKQEAKDDER